MKKSIISILTLLLIATAFQVSAYEFCEEGIQGESKLRLISVDDMLKENSKEWTWETEEIVELELRVENKNDESNDYIAEIIFLDEDEEKVRMADDRDDLETEFSLSGNERKSISMTFEIDEDMTKDEYNMFVKVYKKRNEDVECVENSEEKIIIEKVELCEDGKVDIDDLEITKIQDYREDNEDEWVWAPGNSLGINVDLENKDYSERNFVIKLIMLNEDNEEVNFAKDDNDLKEELELDENENDDVEFSFKLDNDLEEGLYSLYAKAYDEDDEEICTSLKAETKSEKVEIEIKRAERRVIVTKVKGPTAGEFSSTIEYNVTVENLGGKTEEKVSVIIYNGPLKIRETIEIDDLASGKEKTVTLNVKMPENASLARQKLTFSTEYEYNKESDYFKSESKTSEDKKIYLTLTPKEEVEVEEIENETIISNETVETNEPNQTIIETPIEEPEIPTTAITGNVIGESKNDTNWGVILGLVALAGIGVFLFTKKPKVTKETPIVTPNITRRYTAKLNS